MEFKKIDVNNWKRRVYFEHYFSNVPCTYSMTAKIEITKLINSGKRLYPSMLYCITSIVNKYEEFRTAFNNKGELGIYKTMNPSYTIFHKESQTFSNLWTEYNEDYYEFCKAYENDLMIFGDKEDFQAKPHTPENVFNVSMIPWVSFEGFNLNLKNGYDYLLPIFTMGKYYNENDKVFLPLAIQVHHAVCDGFHVSRFLEDLQNMILKI